MSEQQWPEGQPDPDTLAYLIGQLGSMADAVRAGDSDRVERVLIHLNAEGGAGFGDLVMEGVVGITVRRLTEQAAAGDQLAAEQLPTARQLLNQLAAERERRGGKDTEA